MTAGTIKMTSLQSHLLLKKLAEAPIEHANFPIHFNVVLRLRTVLSNPDASFKQAIDILAGEPLISARIVSAANTAANRIKEPILDVEKAIFRIGLTSARRIALGVAMVQLNKSKDMLVFADQARAAWLHSLYAAASAHVIAKAATSIHPDEAEVCGLLLNLGAFYLLYQASQHPELHKAKSDVSEAVETHCHRLTIRLLEFLDLPSATQEALSFDPQSKIDSRYPPKTLKEIILTAHLLASDKVPWGNAVSYDREIHPSYLSLTEEIDHHYASMQDEYR